MKQNVKNWPQALATIVIISSCFFLASCGSALETVSKTLNTLDQVSSSLSATTTSSSGQVTNPHKDINVKLLNYSLSGKNVIIEYLITNDVADLDDYRIWGEQAVDNLGNQYEIENIFGKNREDGAHSTGNNLTKGVPIKVQTTIYNVNEKASKLTLVRIGTCSFNYSSYKVKGDIVFRDLVIR